MIKTRALLTVLAFLALGVVFNACHEKEIENTEFNGGSIPYDETKTDRAYLEETATKLMAMFVPSDQQYLIGVINQFANLCETCEFPENFDADYTASSARSLSDAIAGYDAEAISRATSNFAYSIARFKGLYQHNSNTDSWQYLEDDDNIIFRFWNGTREYNVSLSGTEGSWVEVVNTPDGTYTVDIPKTISLLIVDGSMSLKPTYIFSADIKTDGKDSDHLRVNSEITAANLLIESVYDSTNTKAKVSTTLSVDDTKTLYRTCAVATVSEINGNGLCSAASWVAAESANDPDQALARMVTSASSTVMVIDRVQFKTKVNDLASLVKYADGWWDRYDGDPEAKARQAASALINSLSTDVYYANNTSDNPVRARLSWEAVKADNSWGDYNEWTVRPLITFTSDNTPYGFEEYFGNGRFISVEKSFNSLFRTYRSYWK